MRDPYAGLARTMQETAQEARPAGMCLGRVTKIGKGVLEIKADNGLELDQEDLLVNSLLQYDAVETENHEITASQNTVLGVNRQVPCLAMVGPYELTAINLYDLPGTFSGGFDSRMTVSRLAVNDQVLMQPVNDGQTYVVLCKVVKA